MINDCLKEVLVLQFFVVALWYGSGHGTERLKGRKKKEGNSDERLKVR